MSNRRLACLAAMLAALGLLALPGPGQASQTQNVSFASNLLSTMHSVVDLMGQASSEGRGREFRDLDHALNDMVKALKPNVHHHHHHHHHHHGAFSDGMGQLANFGGGGSQDSGASQGGGQGQSGGQGSSPANLPAPLAGNQNGQGVGSTGGFGNTGGKTGKSSFANGVQQIGKESGKTKKGGGSIGTGIKKTGDFCNNPQQAAASQTSSTKARNPSGSGKIASAADTGGKTKTAHQQGSPGAKSVGSSTGQTPSFKGGMSVINKTINNITNNRYNITQINKSGSAGTINVNNSGKLTSVSTGGPVGALTGSKNNTLTAKNKTTNSKAGTAIAKNGNGAKDKTQTVGLTGSKGGLAGTNLGGKKPASANTDRAIAKGSNALPTALAQNRSGTGAKTAAALPAAKTATGKTGPTTQAAVAKTPPSNLTAINKGGQAKTGATAQLAKKAPTAATAPKVAIAHQQVAQTGKINTAAKSNAPRVASNPAPRPTTTPVSHNPASVHQVGAAVHHASAPHVGAAPGRKK